MRKGISPIVAVVLLIAIAVIAAVGLYFWVGGLATKQPTPSTPGTITAICSGTNRVITVSNTGTETIDASTLLVSSTNDDVSVSQTAGNCTAGLGPGDSCIYGTASLNDAGFVYAANIAQAAFSC